jgi:hypothetical protein
MTASRSYLIINSYRIFIITFDILINTLVCLETRRLTRELRSLVRCCLNPQLAFGSRSVASLVRLRLTCSSPSPSVRLFGFASRAHSGRLWWFLLCFYTKTKQNIFNLIQSNYYLIRYEFIMRYDREAVISLYRIYI